MNQTAPLKRLRRLRRSETMRSMLRENDFSLDDLIHPIFIEENINEQHPISTLPGINRFPESHLADEIKELYDLGIRAVMPFGISHHKDEQGSDTWQADGLLARMIKTIKQATRVCVCVCVCVCSHNA